MPSSMSIRYAPAKPVGFIIRQNENIPVAIVEHEALYDRFLRRRVVRFRLRNDMKSIIDSAAICVRFYRRVRGKDVLISTRTGLAVAPFALKIRPGDMFGPGLIYMFPRGEVDTVEIAVTKVYVVDFPGDDELPEEVAYAEPGRRIWRPREEEKPSRKTARSPKRGSAVPAASPVSTGEPPAETENKRRIPILPIVIPAVLLAIALPLAVRGISGYNQRRTQYEAAMAAAEEDAGAALPLLVALGDYRDVPEQIYHIGEEAEAAGNTPLAMAAYRSAYTYADAGKKYRAWSLPGRLAGGVRHAVALTTEGTVLTASAGSEETDFGQTDVGDWSEVAGISAGQFHTVGIDAQGRTLAAGAPEICDVEGWMGMSQVTAGPDSTVGLRKTGEVRFLGGGDCGQDQVKDWEGILRISAGESHTVALNGLGRARTTAFTGDASRDYGQCDVDGWSNLVDICAASSHTIGLRADGRVISTKYTGPSRRDYGQRDVEDWENIVAVSATGWHSVGLHSDGTVVAAGKNTEGECDVSEWENMLAVYAGNGYTLGLGLDGTVSVAGSFPDEESDAPLKEQIAAWRLW